MSYRIGSFNLCNFSGRADKDVRTIVHIILREQFDIIALQEVLDQRAFSSIQARLPYYWQGSHAVPKSRYAEQVVSGKNQNTGKEIVTAIQDSAKGYGFIWNSRRISLCAEEPEIFTKIKNGEFIRNPYYGRFMPALGGPFFEFRLINLHLCNPEEGKERQTEEYKTAVEEVYSRISNMNYGDNRPAYTILLGDYSMPLAWCTEIESTLRLENQKFISELDENTFLQDSETLAAQHSNTDNKKSIVKSVGNIISQTIMVDNPLDFVMAFANIVDSMKTIINAQKSIKQNKKDIEDESFFAGYDHFGYDIQRFTAKAEVVLNIERINAVQKYYRSDFVNYRKQVSDHIPIKIEVILNDYFYKKGGSNCGK